jgi:YegS/Rv2252/BmrU family lipid kinase
MKILFILNPVSGNKNRETTVLRIHEKAVELGFDFKFFYTTGKDDDRAIQHQIKEYKPDRVIAGGGDGTLQMVARNLLSTKIPLGVLPMGSANGFATAVGISLDPVEAVDSMINASSSRPLDLLKFNNEHLCIHLGDIGINAMMVMEYSNSDQRGMIAYARHLIRSMQDSPLVQYTIKTDKETYTLEGYMLAFANANKYGTGIHISEGSISDGKFEIVNVPRIAFEDAIKAGLTIWNLFVDKDMFADVISCKRAEVTISEKVDFQIDGEYMGKIDHLTIEILPAAIPLLVP